jgi:hypothetical protein
MASVLWQIIILLVLPTRFPRRGKVDPPTRTHGLFSPIDSESE